MRNRVWELRQAKGLRPGEFAKQVNISRAYLNKIERGRCNPSVNIAGRIAEALGESIEMVFLAAVE